MKLLKKRNGLLAAVAASMVAGSANAQTQLHIDYDTTYQGNISLAGYIGSEDVYLTPFQATYEGGAPLPFPTTNPFNTFCVDISPDLNQNGTWTAGTFPLTPPNGNSIQYVPGGIQSAASIYNAFVGNVNISTGSGQLWGAALQLAIWNDLYDGDNTVSGGVFSVSGGNSALVVGLADSILTSAYNFANPNLTSTFWNATDPSVQPGPDRPANGNRFCPRTRHFHGGGFRMRLGRPFGPSPETGVELIREHFLIIQLSRTGQALHSLARFLHQPRIAKM